MANILVAKSYQNLPFKSDVYVKNGKQYIQVELKSGLAKEVRVYSEKEYAKAYGESPIKETIPQRVILGFGEQRFLTIFYGEGTYENKEWFKSLGAVYRKFWGWGLASIVPCPDELPEGVKAARLEWADVCRDADHLGSEDQIQAAVAKLIYEPSKSQYVGAIGDRLDIEVKITKIIPIEGFYGSSTIFIMQDEYENEFVWITSSSKDWELESVHHIRGTVKEHKVNKYGVNQTVLTRCAERK